MRNNDYESILDFRLELSVEAIDFKRIRFFFFMCLCTIFWIQSVDKNVREPSLWIQNRSQIVLLTDNF